MKMKISSGNGAGQPSSPTISPTSPTFRLKRWLGALSQATFATWLAILVSFTVCANATEICGPSISGTWTPTGNPYMITCDSTVPAGQTLTIQPGVEVWMFSNVTFTVNGLIQAVGTPSQRIKIGINDPWWRGNTIMVNGTVGTNRFMYCDFQNASTALNFNSPNTNEVMYCNFRDVTTGMRQLATGGGFMNLLVANCTFSNCTVQASYGESWGWGWDVTTVNLVFQNCQFNAGSNGCVFLIGNNGYGYGQASLKATGNVFQNLTGTALNLTINGGAGGSPAAVINNAFVSCRVGVAATDQWDATVQNCIFVGCTNATMRTGSLSLNVGYNDYFGNATNFVNYPASWGPPVLHNGNGTPCDVHYNIFQNPLFCETTNYTLSATSPCVDAGNPAGAYLDNCFATSACQVGSLGTVTNDMGLYGGPNACGWVVPPWNPSNFTLAAQRYFGAIVNPGVPGHYRIEWSPIVTGGTWTQATNVWLTNFPYIYIDYDSPSVSERFYRGVLLP